MFESLILYNMYFNVSSVNLKENPPEIKKTHTHHIHVASKTVGLSNCLTIELSDHRLDPLWLDVYSICLQFSWLTYLIDVFK